MAKVVPQPSTSTDVGADQLRALASMPCWTPTCLSAMESLSKGDTATTSSRHRRASPAALVPRTGRGLREHELRNRRGRRVSTPAGLACTTMLFARPVRALPGWTEPELELPAFRNWDPGPYAPAPRWKGTTQNLLDQTKKPCAPRSVPRTSSRSNCAAFRDGARRLRRSSRVIDLLAKDLNVVPGVPWAAQPPVLLQHKPGARQAMAHGS